MQAMSQYGLEVLKVLAGIANAERVTAENRELANDSMKYILRDIKEEMIKESAERSGIELNVQ